jgi:hypothetical protein
LAEAPVSDAVLTALRTAATLVHAVPRLRLAVRQGERTVLEVRRPPLPEVPHLVLPPCAFHAAVARGHRMRRAGEQVGMRGIDAGPEPVIALGLPEGDIALPGGMVRLSRDQHWWHLAATPLAPARFRPVLDDPSLSDVAVHGDEVLEASVLYVVTDAGDRPASRRAIAELGTAVARAGVEDLCERLAAPSIATLLADRSAPGRPGI